MKMELAQVQQTLVPEWKGVIRIERQDGADDSSSCRIISCRILDLNGRRAICEMVPYSTVKQFFQSEDADYITRHAEFRQGVLNILERAHPKDFFLPSHQYH